MPPDPSTIRLITAPDASGVLPATDRIETLRDRPSAGLTVREVSRRYRVGEDKVRGWIRRGELRAINTAATLCGKPRWVVTVEALVEFERRRAGGTLPKPSARRRQQQQAIDYYP